jgi:Fe-S-cluster containining protein
MLGTDCKSPRCTALEGEVGESVSCLIYPQRSSTCRQFEASWVDGQHNPECDIARAAFGLAALDPPLLSEELPVPRPDIEEMAYQTGAVEQLMATGAEAQYAGPVEASISVLTPLQTLVPVPEVHRKHASDRQIEQSALRPVR